MAAAPPFKEDMRKYLEWAQRTTEEVPGLVVRLSTEATPEAVAAESPDVLIIAVGGAPAVPLVPGIARENVVWAGDVDLGRVAVGDPVLVVGAGLTGCETALHLAQAGKHVTIIDVLPLEQIASDVHPVSRTALLNLLHDCQVAIRPETRLEAVTEIGVLVSSKGGDKTEIPCASVVLAVGVTPRTDLVERFVGLAAEVHVVGDCRRERGNLGHAVTDGFNAAIDL